MGSVVELLGLPCSSEAITVPSLHTEPPKCKFQVIAEVLAVGYPTPGILLFSLDA